MRPALPTTPVESPRPDFAPSASGRRPQCVRGRVHALPADLRPSVGTRRPIGQTRLTSGASSRWRSRTGGTGRGRSSSFRHRGPASTKTTVSPVRWFDARGRRRPRAQASGRTEAARRFWLERLLIFGLGGCEGPMGAVGRTSAGGVGRGSVEWSGFSSAGGAVVGAGGESKRQRPVRPEPVRKHTGQLTHLC